MGDDAVVDLSELTLDAGNCVRHGERNLAVIRSSLDQFGGLRSIVIDGDNVVIAGNGTVAAARSAGVIRRVRIVDTAPDELVAVRRRDLTGARSAAAALADNRSSDLHVYDERQLRSVIDSLSGVDDVDMDSLALSEDDLRSLFETPGVDPAGADDAGGGDGVDPERRLKVCPECGHEW